MPGNPAVIREVELTRVKPLLRKRAMGVEAALQWLAENPNALVELTLATDTFLTAVDRKTCMPLIRVSLLLSRRLQTLKTCSPPIISRST